MILSHHEKGKENTESIHPVGDIHLGYLHKFVCHCTVPSSTESAAFNFSLL